MEDPKNSVLKRQPHPKKFTHNVQKLMMCRNTFAMCYWKGAREQRSKGLFSVVSRGRLGSPKLIIFLKTCASYFFKGKQILCIFPQHCLNIRANLQWKFLISRRLSPLPALKALKNRKLGNFCSLIRGGIDQMRPVVDCWPQNEGRRLEIVIMIWYLLYDYFMMIDM